MHRQENEDGTAGSNPAMTDIEPLELTPTAWSILGFLSLHPRSGYEIREAAKRSVRMFWGISDGQLYPQLKVLESLQLIEAPQGAEGPRARQRWHLTDKGRNALRQWLATPSAPIQIRDENLVKFLFASREGPEMIVNLIRERRASFEWMLKTIQEIQPGSSWDRPEDVSSLPVPSMLKQYGTAYVQMVLDWCNEAESQLLSLSLKESQTEEEQP